MLAAAGFASVFVMKFTEQIKTQFGLAGSEGKRMAVAAVAYGMGLVISFGFGLAAITELLGPDVGVAPEMWVDKLFTGLAIGAGAGFFNDIAGR